MDSLDGIPKRRSKMIHSSQNKVSGWKLKGLGLFRTGKRKQRCGGEVWLISIRNDKKECIARTGENALNLPQDGFVLNKTKKPPVWESMEEHHFIKERPAVNSILDNCVSKCSSVSLIMKSPFVEISCCT